MAWFDSFDAMQAADLESSFIEGSEWADSVVYHAAGNDEDLTIDCQVSLAQAKMTDESQHETTATIINVLCHKDAATGIANPQLGDSVTWDGREWDYMQTQGDEQGALTLQFQEKSIQQYGKRPSQL